MKFYSRIFLLIPMLLTAGCNKTEDPNKELIVKGDANVILIAGQSNASGNTVWSYLEQKSPDVYNKFVNGNSKVLVSYSNSFERHNEYFEPCKFGMGDSDELFGPEIGIADIFSNDDKTTYIIKYAVGATQLDGQWLDGNGKRYKLYNKAIKWFNNKIKYLRKNGVKPHVAGMFWMQGESDSYQPQNLVFERNHTNLVNYFREDLKRYCTNDLNFVDAFISSKTIWWDHQTVNNVKEKVSKLNPHNFLIKTNGEDETALNLDVKSDCNEGDDMAHYSSLSELELGRRAGQIIKENM